MREEAEVRASFVTAWMEKAVADLEMARKLAEDDRFPDGVAFHAQQATEKAMKALLTKQGIEFSKTHNLARLQILIDDIDAEIGSRLVGVDELTPYAVTYRYPGTQPTLSLAESHRALEIADRVIEAIRKRI